MAFSFLAYLISFWRYLRFCIISGTSNVHHKRNRMTATMLLPWQHSWLQSLSVKNQIFPFATFLSGSEGLARNTHGSHTVLSLAIRLVGVDDLCLKNLTHPLCTARLCYCYYPRTFDVHSLFGHKQSQWRSIIDQLSDVSVTVDQEV